MSPSPAPPNPALPPDYRRDAAFTPPERVPWSQLAPQFALAFGRADPRDPQPEHIEIIGKKGSGKTHFAGKVYQERAHVQERPSIIVATKPVDATLGKIGFPVVNTWDQLVSKVRDGEQNLIYWPRTRLLGSARKEYHNERITDLLDRLWSPGADTDIVIDDWGYTDKLPDVKDRLEQYLREGRSSGLSVGAIKQRPQGSTRLMSSETDWTVAFRPADEGDLERWAELFGARRDWMPVFRQLDPARREFLIQHNTTRQAYISWVDTPLTPVQPRRARRRTIGEFMRGRHGDG
jgi:hypothetical protein